MMPTALGLVVQNGFAVAQVIRMQLPHRVRLPAQRLGNLRSTQAERRPQPDRLHALILGFGFRLWQQRSEPLGGSLRKRLECTHVMPPKAGLSLLLSCCCLMANWYENCCSAQVGSRYSRLCSGGMSCPP